MSCNFKNFSIQERINFCLTALHADLLEQIVSDKFEHWLFKNKFFSAPASTKHHLNYEGGLCEHSYNVMNVLVELTSKNGLVWQRPESPYIIGFFHDLCKYDAYKQAGGDNWVYNDNLLLKGHGEKSVILLSQFITLTEEEIMCIRYHMGAYETDTWQQYDQAIKKYPNVLWTHHADMIASKLMEA